MPAATVLCRRRAGHEVHLLYGGGQVRSETKIRLIADLAGLHRRAPLLALALMVALFGLAGIPPTIGFTGKIAGLHGGYGTRVISRWS